MRKNKSPRYALTLLLLSYLFLMFGNNILSLTIPDEVFYAQTAKEMAKHNSWLTPYLFDQPQFEKPILTYWLLRIAFILFGVSSFSARFFPATFAMIGVFSVYFLGWLAFRDEKKAFLSGLILMSSGLYIGLARTLFTDMIFSVFILLSLLSFFWGYSLRERKSAGLLLFFIFSGLAVLTKGPLGFFVPFLTVVIFLAIKKELKFLLCAHSLWGIFIFALISLPWYIFMVQKYGQSFIQEFFYNDHFRRLVEAEHQGNDTWYFYPFSMLTCMAPWTLFLAAALFFLPRLLRERREPAYLFLACWIGATLLIFQFAHSKLTSYIFPSFPALALLTGDFIGNALSVTKLRRSLTFVLWATGCFLLLAPIGIMAGIHKFPEYITSRIPFYGLIIALLALLITMLYFIFKNKLLKSIYALAPVLFLLLGIIPFIRHDLEPYLSTKDACAYLLQNYTVDNTIICTKFVVRGVRYYTDKDVAVISIPGSPFFSPHPIPFLNYDDKVEDLLRRQPVTYCILKESYLEDIDRITAASKRFKPTFLKKIGGACIVKIEELPKRSQK